MKWQFGLKQFRESRGLTQLQPNYLDMMAEEYDNEYYNAVQTKDWDEQVDAVCDMLVLTENCIQQTHPLVPDYERTGVTVNSPVIANLLEEYIPTATARNLDILYAISDQCELMLRDLGVVPQLAMKACVKYINSRRQDPAQAAEWQADPSLVGTTKWLKDKSQVLEKPNYKLCKDKLV